MPVYRAIPIKHKIIICEPLLEEISLDAYNIGEWVEQVVAGGESGYEARICNFDWIMKLHDICVKTMFLSGLNRQVLNLLKKALYIP